MSQLMVTMVMMGALLLLLLQVPPSLGFRNTKRFTVKQLKRKPLAIESDVLNAACDRKPGVVMKCRKGWSLHVDGEGAICLQRTNKKLWQRPADNFCKTRNGRLLTIKSLARQRTIQRFLQGVDVEVWTAAIKPVGSYTYTWYGENEGSVEYENMKQEYEATEKDLSCLLLKNDTERTWTEANCNTSKEIVCQAEPGCSYLGEVWSCLEECHCYGGGGCVGGKPCGQGCQDGWAGPKCCVRKQAAEVAYYCISSSTIILRIDPRTTSYKALVPVDSEGRRKDWCVDLYVDREPQDSSYVIKIYFRPGRLTDACGIEKTGNNTFTLRLSLQEDLSIRLPYDRTVALTCNFNNAETRRRIAALDVESTKQRSSSVIETLDPTVENVRLEVVDAETGEVLREASLGQAVRLRMSLNLSDDSGVRAKGVSPTRCIAEGEGKSSKDITYYSGCPLDWRLMSSFRGSEGTVSTNVFHLFALQGQSSSKLKFTCQFEFCFTATEQPMCDDRCAVMGRRRRRAAEMMYTVSAGIVVRPGGVSKRDAEHAPKHAA